MRSRIFSLSQMKKWVVVPVTVAALAATSMPVKAATGDSTPPNSDATTSVPDSVPSNDPNAADQSGGGGTKIDGKPGTVGTAKAGVDIVTSVNMIAPVIAGYVYVTSASLSNTGSEMAGAKNPVTFALADLPDYMHLKDISPLVTAQSQNGVTGWQCNGANCTYVQKTDKGIVNGTLPAGAGARVFFRFDVDKGATIPQPPEDVMNESKKLKDAGDIAGIKQLISTLPHMTVTSTTKGDTNAENNDGFLQIVGASQTPFAGTYVDVAMPASVYPGGEFSMNVRVLATGTEDRASGYTLSDLLPAALGLTDVKISGDGWECADATALKTCTNSAGGLKIGTFSPVLTVTATVPKTTKTSDKPIAWEVPSHTVTTVGSDLADTSTAFSVMVVPVPAPDMAIRLIPHDGKASVAAPDSVTIDALVRAGYGPGQDNAILFSIPAGLEFTGLADGTTGWTCKSAEPDAAAGKNATAQSCTKPLMKADTPETVGFELKADVAAKAGPVSVIGTISSSNEAEKYKVGNKVSQSIVVQPLPAPLPAVVLTRPDSKGTSAAVVDGSATEVLIGKSSTYGLEIRNLGGKAIKAGTVVRIDQFVQNDAKFTGPAFTNAQGYDKDIDTLTIDPAKKGEWQCVSGLGTQPAMDKSVVDLQSKMSDGTTTTVADMTTVAATKAAVAEPAPMIRCELTAASDIGNNKSTPILDVTTSMSSDAKEGKPEWPVFGSVPSSESSPVSRYGMTVSIKEYRAELNPEFIVPAGPRPGGSAVATLSVRNAGTATAKAQVLVIPAVKNGNITSAKGESWACITVGAGLSAGFTICSRDTALDKGKQSPNISVDYSSATGSTAPMKLAAVSLVDTPREKAFSKSSTVPVELRPALSFVIKGADTIVDQQIDKKGNRVPTKILLSAQGNANSSTYTWKQVCTTTAELKSAGGECDVQSPKAEWLKGKESNGPNAQFSSPTVTKPTPLVFEATAEENGATATARFTVNVTPIPVVDDISGMVGSGSSVLDRAGDRSVPVSALRAAVPTSGTGDTSADLTADATSVKVNGNVYGDRTVTVAKGGTVDITASATGTGAVTYLWAQAAGPLTSAIASATKNQARLTFAAPATDINIDLRVTATDSTGAVGTDLITIVVGAGGTPPAAVSISQGDGPISIDSAADQTFSAAGTGSGAVTYAWTQLSGPTVTLTNAATQTVTLTKSNVSGTVDLMVTATDTAGGKATDVIRLRLAPSTPPTPLCDFVAAVSGSGVSKVQGYLTSMGINTNLDLSKFAVSSNTCTDASTVTFNNASFSISGFLSVSEATGVISATGLQIQSARFTGPSAWGSPQFAIKSTNDTGMFVPFSRSSATVGSFEGEIESGTMPFMSLPSGWTAGASLRFSVDATGTKSISFSATGTGPNNGSVLVTGAVSTDGTFSLAGSMTNALTIFGTTVNLAGTISGGGAGTTPKVSFSGAIPGPVAVASGMNVSNVTLARDESGVVTGTADMQIGSGDGALNLSNKLNWVDSKNYTFTATSTVAGAAWTPAANVSIPLKSASGSVTVVNGDTTVDVTVLGQDGKPLSGLAINSPTITAKSTCAAGAACVVTANLSADAVVTLGSTSATGKLTGAYDSDKKTSNFKATINSIPVVTGLSLESASLAIDSTGVGSAAVATTATLTGSMSVFGSTVTGTATLAKSGLTLTADLPKIAPFGASGPSFEPGQFSWSTSGVTITPKIPSLPDIKAVSLKPNVPRFDIALAMPAELTGFAGDTLKGISNIAIGGEVDFSTGKIDFSASLASTALNVSGSISRASTTANYVYALSGTILKPVKLNDSATLDTLDFTLGNSAANPALKFAGKGGVTLTMPSGGSLALSGAVTYNSATDYSVALSATAGNWTPFSGLTISAGNFTGSYVRSASNTTMNATFSSTSTWTPFPGLTVSNPGVAVAASCTVGSACKVTASASGQVAIDLGSGVSTKVALTGSFVDGTSSLSAKFADIPLFSGATITAPTLSITYNAKDGLSASVSGSSAVLGTTVTMAATFTSKGVVVSGGFDDWKPLGDSGPTLSSAQVVYANFSAANFTIPTAPKLGPVTLSINKPAMIASLTVPGWLKDMLKQPTLNVVPVSIPLADLAGGKLPTLKIMLPTPDNWYLYNQGNSYMRFTGLGFEIAGTPKPSMSLIGTVLMGTGQANQPAVPFEVRGTIGTAAVNMSLSLGLDPATGNAFAWNNAFGISGLTLTQAALQVGVTLTAPLPLPSLGIVATAQLPATWRQYMGMENSVAVKIAANLDITQPCFSFQAGTLGADNSTITNGTAKVINVGSGALTSTFMNLTVAPLGCKIGNVTFDQGVSANFNGTVLGTPVDVAAKIGTSPFALEASVAVGAFNAGPVKVDQTTIGVKVSPTESYVSFAGGVTVGSTRVAVSGKSGYNTTDGPYLQMTGNVDNLVIVPSFLEVKTASVSLDLRPKTGTFNILANGDFTFLGSPSKVSLDLKMANYQLQSVAASLQTRRTVGVVTIDGTFNVAYTAGSTPSIAFDAVASAAGYDIGRATGVINANQFSMTATASISSVFSAQITGQVVWQAGNGITVANRSGQQVTASAGDFRLAATNVTINLGGFNANGSIAIGKVGTLTYGDFAASFAIGAGDVGGQVSVAGSFSSDGNFSFTGTGSLNLVGFTGNATVSGSKSGANWAFALNANITVMGAVNVGFGGNVYKTNGLTRFTMNGSAAIDAAGVAGARGDFRISNEPGQAGLYAGISINFAGINGNGALWVGADGTFDATLNVGVNFPGISAGGNLRIGNVAWSGATRYKGGTYVTLDSWVGILGVWFRLYGNINPNGSFQFTASAGPWGWDTGLNLGFVEFGFHAWFSSSITITSWSPYVSVQAAGTAWMDGRWWECHWSGGWRPKLRCGWDDWNRWATVGMGFNTNPGNVWIDLGGYHFGIR